MSEHMFGLHSGHLTGKADKIAKRHGAWHTNYTEPRGQRRGWFSCRNLGEPFDSAVAKAVLADIDHVGGLDALRMQRDRLEHNDG
jgi:hypothetical protein